MSTLQLHPNLPACHPPVIWMGNFSPRDHMQCLKLSQFAVWHYSIKATWLCWNLTQEGKGFYILGSVVARHVKETNKPKNPNQTKKKQTKTNKQISNVSVIHLFYTAFFLSTSMGFTPLRSRVVNIILVITYIKLHTRNEKIQNAQNNYIALNYTDIFYTFVS